MHIGSRKDLNKAELETVRISKNPTTVVTANGEVQTEEVATVNVKELDLFVTVMLVFFYHLWTSGQKPHLINDGTKIDCNTANYVPFVVLGLSTSSSTFHPHLLLLHLHHRILC